MRTRTYVYGFLCICLFLLSACSGYEKVLKSDDINYKLSKANEYYDKKQYTRASTIYESLLPVMKGTRNFEPLYYKYAYSYYYLKDYLASSYHFKNFVEYFPASKDAEEAEYLHAVSLSRLSPKPSLEQTNTIKAMEAMQSYINVHPGSKRLEEANKLMQEMRAKLEEKDAGAAKLYYNITQYKAAAVAYKTVLTNYPDSPNSDEYQFMIAKAYYHYAKSSILEKQEERYASSINAFRELKEGYPHSKHVDEAEKYLGQANNNLKKLRNEQHQ
jgi:outer membrane protein assembly factor BamD